MRGLNPFVGSVRVGMLRVGAHLRCALFPTLLLLSCVVSQATDQANDGQVPIPCDHLIKDVLAKPTRKISDRDAPGFIHVEDPFPSFPKDSIVPSDPVGFLPGSGSVTTSGEATYSIPLAVPPGRGSVGPRLALSYGSRSPNGLLGVGWSLSGLSEIRRCAKTIASNGVTDGIAYTPSDSLCLDGQRLVRLATPDTDAAAHETEYRTEHDTFARIVRVGQSLSDPAKAPTGFRVYKKSGLILDYQAQLTDQWSLDPSDKNEGFTPVTYSWLLSDVTDRSGNSAHYAYTVDPGGLEVRIASIAYSGSTVTGEPPLRKIVFHYEPRPDPWMGWEAGGRTTRTQRLAKIEMMAPNPRLTQVVWSYTLSYRTNEGTQRSLLESVRRCDAEGLCTWGKVFSWTEGFSPPNVYDLHTEAFRQEITDPGFLVFDADGDGTQDLLYRTRNGVFLRTGEHGAPLIHLHNVTVTLVRHKGVLGLSRTADVFGDGRKALYAAETRFVDGCFWFGYQLYRWDAGPEDFLEVGPFHKELSSASTTGCGIPFAVEQQFPEVTFVDMNGDGLPDLVDTLPENGGFGNWQVHLNLGDGSFGAPIDSGVFALFQPIHAVELDGDGRGDVLIPDTTGAETLTSATLSVALSLTPEGTLAQRTTQGLRWGTTLNPYSDEDINLVLADLNGDGLTDALYPPGPQASPSATQIRWNTGKGFLPMQTISLGIPLADAHRATRVADVNGDGRDDLIHFGRTIQVCLSLGAGLASPVDTRIDPGRPTRRHLRKSLWNTVELGDFTGDGLVDVVVLAEDHLRVTELPWRENQDLLSGVRDEALSSTRDHFAYARKWYGSTGCAFPQRCPHSGFPVVTTFATTAGITATGQDRYHSWDYAYEDPRFDAQGHGFLGFGTTRVFDRLSQSETITTFDHQTRRTFLGDHGVTAAVYPFAGLPAKVVQIQPIFPIAPGELAPEGSPPFEGPARVIEVQRTYTMERSESSYVVNPSRTETQEWLRHAVVHGTTVGLPGDPSAKLERTRSESSKFDSFGNLVRREIHAGADQVVTNTYDNRTKDWLIGLRMTTSVDASSSGLPPGVCEPSKGHATRHTSYTYNDAGQLITETVEPGDTDPAVTSTTTLQRNDPRGLVTAVVRSAPNAASRTVKLAYDPEGVFVQQASDDLGHTQTDLHYPSNGAVVVSRDANGVETVARYDGFGRIKHLAPPDGNTVAIDYTPYHPVTGRVEGIWVSAERADGTQVLRAVDDLGRSVSEVTRGFAGNWIHSRTTYNSTGQVERSYRPGFDRPSAAFTQYEYDSLGRLLKTAAPTGTTTFLPETFRTTVSDPRHNMSWTDLDLANRVIASTNVAGGQPIVTRYCYDDFSNVKAVMDADGHWTRMDHDAIGRTTAVSSPDSGDRQIAYNGLGDRLTEVDALGTTTYHYDPIGRLQRIDDRDGVTTYEWDTAKNGIGKLARSVSPDGIANTFVYDPVGRIRASHWTVGDEDFAVITDYDAVGRLDRITYPEVPGRPVFQVRQVYNLSGYLESVREESPHTSPRTLWSVDSRNADLALVNSTFGSGKLHTTRTFEPTTGKLQAIELAAPGNRYAFSLAYAYDPNGNVTARNETTAGRAESFGYDELNRLTNWTVGGAQLTTSAVYAYDRLGNIKTVDTNGGVETALYGQGSLPHALTSNSTVGAFTYDARGRQLTGAGRSTTYTNFDLPKTILTQHDTTTFNYDAAGQRVRKNDATGTTITLGRLYERRQQGATTQHVFYVGGEGGPVAQVVYDEATKAERTLFLERDALGSVHVVFDEQGTKVEERYLDPWGRHTKADGSATKANPSDAVTLGFGGHQEDTTLGLVNMRGRMYDPAQRRFLTADTVIPNPLYGQAYNRWAYAYNNPLRFTDPSGHGVTCDDCGSIPAQILRPVDLQPGPDVTNLTPGNAPSPDVTGPGGNDLRVVSDFPSPPEGIHGEYSNWEAWALDLNAAMTAASFDTGGIGATGALEASGNKFSPYTDEGRLGRALFGAERPLNLGDIPEQAKGPIRAALHFVPLLNAVTVLGDANASTAGKLWAVGSDMAMVVPVLGVVGRAAGGGLRLGRAGVVAAEAAEALPAAVRYTATDVGPLSQVIARTFRGGSYTATTLSEPLRLYRGFGGSAGPLGSYWTRVAPSGPLQLQLDSALVPSWGNALTGVSSIEVPAGTTVFEGFAAPQSTGFGTLLGGGSQVYIPRVDPGWLVP